MTYPDDYIATRAPDGPISASQERLEAEAERIGAEMQAGAETLILAMQPVEGLLGDLRARYEWLESNGFDPVELGYPLDEHPADALDYAQRITALYARGKS